MKPLLFHIRCWWFLLSSLVCHSVAYAQDPAYTQAFLSPIYLNPAATGAGDYDLRVSAIYRKQWWLIRSNFNSAAFSVDKFMGKNVGIGLLGTHSSAGHLKRNGVYGTIVWAPCPVNNGRSFNKEDKKWFPSFGFQAGLAQTRIDYSKLIFADQINSSGVIWPSVSAADPDVNSGRLYPDFAAGLFLNHSSGFLLGISAHHLNQPDESLTASNVSQIPLKWTGNFVWSIYPGNSWVLNVSGIASHQGVHQRYQFGFEATNAHYNGVSLGLFYGSSYETGINTVGITLAFNLLDENNRTGEKLRIGFDHDAQVRNQGYTRTGGSSEFGMVWDYDTGKAGTMCKPKINPYECPEWGR